MKILILLISLCASGFAMSEIVVVVHPTSSVQSLSGDDVSRLFLGKTKNFPNGSLAVPVNQDEGQPARAKFIETACRKNSSQYKAYWSQLVFTGKGTPPKDAGNDTDVKNLVASNPNMIGYIDEKFVDGTVKVVFKIP